MEASNFADVYVDEVIIIWGGGGGGRVGLLTVNNVF